MGYSRKDKININNQKIDKYSKFLVILIFIILIIYLIGLCLTDVPSFDGAMNLQISESLAKTGLYATNYDGITLFDERIQTGAPVLILISIIIKIFGKNLPLILSVNACFILFLFFVIRKILRKLNISDFFVAILLLFLFLNPFLYDSGMGIYGEIPTLSLFLSSVFLLLNENISKSKFFFSGICLGIAYLTKTVILISLPAFVIVFALNLYLKRIKIKDCIFWFFGLLSFILIFEIYKCFSLGIENYFSWWNEQFTSILEQAGVKSRFSDTANTFQKIFLHIKIFCRDFNINIILFLFITIFDIVIFIRKIIDEISNKKFNFENIIFITSTSYMVWWIAITPTEKAWPRRIINGSILLAVSTLILFVYFIRKYCDKINKIKFVNIYKTAFGIFITVILCINIGNLPKINNSKKVAIYNMVEYIQNIKKEDINAIFCGIGWLQAPVISFLANEQFYDFRSIQNMDKNIYVVIDEWAIDTAKNFVYSEIESTEYKKVYNDDKFFYYIYKINNFMIPFTDDDYKLADKSSYKLTEQYKYTKGFYEYEVGSSIRWSKKVSAILLKNNNNAKKLYIRFKVPLLNSLDHKDVNMEVFVNEVLAKRIKIDHEGLYEFDIDVGDIIKMNDVAEIKFKMNSRILTIADSRQLSFMFEEASLKN